MLVTPEILLKFAPFQQLSEDQLQKLLGAGDMKLFQSASGEKIIARGSNDAFSFFLVSGTLKLVAKDGQTAVIKADSESAKQPITQLRPRQYDVLAADNLVKYLKINNQILDNLSAGLKTASGIHVENEPGNADIYFQVYQDIKRDRVVIPSLQNIAGNINKIVTTNTKLDARQLAQLVMVDPAIVVKLIKLTSVKVEGSTTVEAEHMIQVINSLGLAKATEIVRVLSAKDIFVPVSAEHGEVARELWRETLFITALAVNLAQEFEHLDPRKAQLIGLSHNVGTMLVLESVGKDQALVADTEHLRSIVTELSANISGMLLERWDFPREYVNAAQEAQNWQRSNEGKALDYSDLIIIAKLLSAVATPKVEQLPVLTELAVFRKLNWGGNGVKKGLQVIGRARQNMQNTTQGFDNHE